MLLGRFVIVGGVVADEALRLVQVILQVVIRPRRQQAVVLVVPRRHRVRQLVPKERAQRRKV